MYDARVTIANTGITVERGQARNDAGFTVYFYRFSAPVELLQQAFEPGSRVWAKDIRIEPAVGIDQVVIVPMPNYSCHRLAPAAVRAAS